MGYFVTFSKVFWVYESWYFTIKINSYWIQGKAVCSGLNQRCTAIQVWWVEVQYLFQKCQKCVRGAEYDEPKHTDLNLLDDGD